MTIEHNQNLDPPIHKRVEDVEIGETFTYGGAIYLRVDPRGIGINQDEIILLHLDNNDLYKGLCFKDDEDEIDKSVTMMNTKVVTY